MNPPAWRRSAPTASSAPWPVASVAAMAGAGEPGAVDDPRRRPPGDAPGVDGASDEDRAKRRGVRSPADDASEPRRLNRRFRDQGVSGEPALSGAGAAAGASPAT